MGLLILFGMAGVFGVSLIIYALVDDRRIKNRRQQKIKD